VGWSSIYPPDVLTNRDPNVSDVVPRGMMTPAAQLGTALMGQAGKPVPGIGLGDAEVKANNYVEQGMNVAGATQPIRAFHGSPHTFDRFDLSKIGTGEGAQAYGHGLYFAGAEDVAKQYRDTLRGTRHISNDAVRDIAALPNVSDEAMKFLRWQFDAQGGDIDKAIRWARNGNLELRAIPEAALKPAVEKMADVAKGSMYEVNLRTSPERLLDWDKPLSAQPEKAAKALVKAGYPQYNVDAMLGARPEYARMAIGEGETGLPRFLQKPETVEAFRKQGLDGIQYLDAGSRAAGDGSRNYVMFRDDIVDILRRYGLFGLSTAMGGAAAASGVKAPEQ
jgi:hypothetical protein